MNQIYREEFIDLKEIFKVLWQGKLLLLYITIFFSLGSVLYSLNLPNTYQSSALLSAVTNHNSGIQSNYSTLANIAGINLNSTTNDGNTEEAIEKIKTLSFFSDNILPNIFLPNLMAFDAWDSKTNTVTYNENIFNNKNKKWVRSYKFPNTQVPSRQESFKIFKKHLSISESEDNSFITISVKHQSPIIAQNWTEMIVTEINNFFRARDKLEAQASINFLNSQISKTTFAEIKQVIAQLLQEETKTLTLIEANDFYVFEYIDPPVVMERKIGPRRSIICIFGAFLGGILGILIVLIRHFFKEQKF